MIRNEERGWGLMAVGAEGVDDDGCWVESDEEPENKSLFNNEGSMFYP